MSSINIEILNPKAKQLLLDLAELRLISINEKSENPFAKAVKKIRAKKAKIDIAEISGLVEEQRAKRYGK